MSLSLTHILLLCPPLLRRGAPYIFFQSQHLRIGLHRNLLNQTSRPVRYELLYSRGTQLNSTMLFHPHLQHRLLMCLSDVQYKSCYSSEKHHLRDPRFELATIDTSIAVALDAADLDERAIVEFDNGRIQWYWKFVVSIWNRGCHLAVSFSQFLLGDDAASIALLNLLHFLKAENPVAITLDELSCSGHRVLALVCSTDILGKAFRTSDEFMGWIGASVTTAAWTAELFEFAIELDGMRELLEWPTVQV